MDFYLNSNSSDMLPADQVIIGSVISFAFWGIFSIAANMAVTKTKGDEYASRIVSTVHAMVSLVFCVAGAIDGYGEAHWGIFGLDATAKQQIALMVTTGYFSADFIGILVGTYFDWIFVGHHIVSASSLFYSAYFGYGGFELCLATALMELSNPFMHMRWIVVTDKHPSDSLVYKICDEGFFISFTLARIVLGPYLVWLLWISSSAFVFKLTAGALMVFSFQFYWGLLQRRKTGEAWK